MSSLYTKVLLFGIVFSFCVAFVRFPVWVLINFVLHAGISSTNSFQKEQ